MGSPPSSATPPLRHTRATSVAHPLPRLPAPPRSPPRFTNRRSSGVCVRSLETSGAPDPWIPPVHTTRYLHSREPWPLRRERLLGLPPKPSSLAPPGSAALLAAGSSATCPQPENPVETLLEVLSVYLTVLTFLFLGERSGARGPLGKEGPPGGGGEEGWSPTCRMPEGKRRGRGKRSSWELAKDVIGEGGREEPLAFSKRIHFPFFSFLQALSCPFLSPSPFSQSFGFSLFPIWHGSTWTGTRPSKVSTKQGFR